MPIIFGTRGMEPWKRPVVVSVHQLHYLPWLRYFEKIAAADVFIVLDNIQFNKNGWQNRNRIKTAAGPLILTVPVYEKAGQRLDEVRLVSDTRWNRKHLRSLEQAYRRAPYFPAHIPFLQDVYEKEWSRLNDLNRHLLAYFLEALALPTRVIYASSLDVPGIATERLVNLVRAVNGSAYYSGAHAAETYLDTARFEAAGIQILVQEWTPPVYPQLYDPFIPDLSIVDLLLNCGPDSLAILRSGRP